MTVVVVPDVLGMKLLFDTPGTGTAHELERIADDVVELARDNLSTPYPGRKSRNPGPFPYERSGQLKDKIHHDGATIVAGELEVIVSSDAEHRGEFYWPILRDKWGLKMILETSFS